MLEHKPHHVRRKIALLCTGAIALILLVVLLVYYIRPSDGRTDESGSRLKAFFTTVRENPQSSFE